MNKILAALFASAVSFGAFAQATGTTTTAPAGAGAASGGMATEKSSAPMREHAAEKKAHGSGAALKAHDNKGHEGKHMDKKHHNSMEKAAASKPAA